MEIIEQIENEVAKLDYAWYKTMRKRYESEGLFNKAKDKIYDELPVNGDEGETEHQKIEIGFSEYTWDYCGTFTKSDNIHDIPCGYTVTRQVLSALKTIFTIPANGDEIPTIIDVRTKNLIIENVVNLVVDKVSILKNQKTGSKEYHDSLDYFTMTLRQEISNRYRKIKQLALLADYDNNALKFKIPEIAISRLLLILIEAEIIESDNNKFLNFCQNYFSYSKKKEYKKATGIKKSFRVANSDLTFKQSLGDLPKRLKNSILLIK